ncbi:hypothetical protein LW135_00105 [Helicobacter sp. faydin-H20]|uniref:hypothetical protein n=1 Tax=Helicobacter anatolicus TaxID=2905874 RepID=UPI001E54205F|nr:hypothetical protein [Helicobacter anatolicus]MCE3036234.1 hypothetical protein [Helicobacter anatolicus]
MFIYSFGVVAAVVMLTGCSTVVAAKVDKNVDYIVQFNGGDFDVGSMVTTEMPYEPNNKNMMNLLLNKALIEHKCDVILLPRYEVVSKTFGKDIIRITGRAANFKTKR